MAETAGVADHKIFGLPRGPRPGAVPDTSTERVYDPDADRARSIVVALPWSGPHDAAAIAILTAPAATGEPASVAFARKEAELRALFATLAPVEAVILARRLAAPRPGDALARELGRMVPERRQRLIHFLADTRRRAAIAGQGR